MAIMYPSTYIYMYMIIPWRSHLYLDIYIYTVTTFKYTDVYIYIYTVTIYLNDVNFRVYIYIFPLNPIIPIKWTIESLKPPVSLNPSDRPSGNCSATSSEMKPPPERDPQANTCNELKAGKVQLARNKISSLNG